MSPNKPTISAIVAISENRVIGHENRLPWHLPADLKHFRALTTGYPIIMGRKTYESIGKPLPQRTNIIVTRDKNYSAEGCIITFSLDEAIAAAAQSNPTNIFIIGGSEIFNQCLASIDRVYMTIIKENFKGDAFFPELDKNKWKVETAVDHFKDDKNIYDYSFITYKRSL